MFSIKNLVSGALGIVTGGWMKWIGLGLGAVLLVAVAWMWNDYQSLREEYAVQAVQLEKMAATHVREMEQAHRVMEQYRVDLALQAEVAAERQARNTKLAAWIAEMKILERRSGHATDEVGPAVSFALDRLREDTEGHGSGDRGRDPGPAAGADILR